MNDCIFCRIIAKQVPSPLLYESDDVIAFNDLHPVAPIHILIVPKKHIPTFHDIDEEDAAIVLHVIQTAQQLLRERKLHEDGYRFGINGGKFQHVPHLHWHLISQGHIP